MTQACKICNHSDRLNIDRALVAGRSLAALGREYDVGTDSLRNHLQNHLSRQLVKSHELRTAMEGGNLLNEIEELLTRSKHILRRAEHDGRLNLALNAIKETRGTLELMSRIAVTLHQIRAQELEAERVRESEKVTQTQQEGLERLSTTELFMLVALQEKMEGQRDGDVISDVLKEMLPSLIETQPTRRTRRNNPLHVDEEWNEEREAAALEEERLAALEEESLSPLATEPLPPIETRRAGTWNRGDDPFPRRVVPGSIRTTIPDLSDF